MANEIENIINLIKFKTGNTIEQIASKIGYSREYLTAVKNSGKGEKVIIALQKEFKEILQNVTSESINKEEKKDIIQKPYHQKRHEQKLNNENDTLDFYEVGANAATETTAEIIPIPKTDKQVLHISDLFKGSQFAIRISGNSMTPLYPSGAIIGIKWIEDKTITPGSVYVIEKGNDLLIKRLFYKDDNQDSGYFEAISDNTMKHESGHRIGKLCYPHFYIEIDKVRKLFKVTGIFKSNELIMIN